MRQSVKKTTSEITYDIKEPDFKPKHKKPLPKKHFKKGYNGFEPNVLPKGHLIIIVYFKVRFSDMVTLKRDEIYAEI